MSFVLKKARIQRHVERIAITPPCFKPEEDDSTDWIKKIFTKNKKICELEDNVQKTLAKIGKICTDTV